MPQFEYDLSAGDFQLVANQQDGVFDTNSTSTDYIRLTVFPTEALDNAVGVFYASPSNVGVYINITPFEGLSDNGNNAQYLLDPSEFAGSYKSVTNNKNSPSACFIKFKAFSSNPTFCFSGI